MRSIVDARLVNEPFGDPGVYVDVHFSPRYAEREAALRAELETAFRAAGALCRHRVALR